MNPKDYGHRWHDMAANHVLVALQWQRDAIMTDNARNMYIYLGNVRDRLLAAEACSEVALNDERQHGSVFPGVPS